MKQSALLPKTTIKISSGNKPVIMDRQFKEDTDSPKDNIEDLISRGRDYFETRMELLKLKAVDKSADVISSMASTVIVAVVFTFFFLFLNIGLGIWIGDLLNSRALGFVVLAVLYLITGLILNASKDKWIKEPVTTSLIKKLFK
jgi:hypothetical protein